MNRYDGTFRTQTPVIGTLCIQNLMLIAAIFISNAVCQDVVHAQISASVYNGSQLQTNSSTSPNGGYVHGASSQNPQESFSYSYPALYNQGAAGVTASVSLSVNTQITSTSIDSSGSFQVATTDAFGGAAAEEYSFTRVPFTTTQTVYYTCTSSITVTNTNASPTGYALLQNSQDRSTSFYMGAGAAVYGPSYSSPGTITGVLSPGQYFLQVGVQTPTTGLLGGDSSASTTFSFHAFPVSAPSVTAGTVTNLTPTTATINGSINPLGLPATAYVEYWNFANSPPDPHQKQSITLNPTDSTTPQSVSIPISGLIPDSTYLWQIVATNAAGTTTVAGQTFVTPIISTLQFDQASYRVHENVGIATVAIDRASGSSGQVSVFCQITDGTATEPLDFFVDRYSYTQTLTWADGDTQPKFLDLDVFDRKIRDGSQRTATITLTNPSTNAQIGSPATTTFAIFYDDPPAFTVDVETVPNPNSSGTYREFNLLGVGAPNTMYTVQSSPDMNLNNFKNVATVTTDSAGNFQYLDPIIDNQKFYRIVYPQTLGSQNTLESKTSAPQVR